MSSGDSDPAPEPAAADTVVPFSEPIRAPKPKARAAAGAPTSRQPLASRTPNASLNPVRAEVKVALEVLTDAHAKDNRAVQDALDFTLKTRRNLAKMFYDKAASSGTRTGQD